MASEGPQDAQPSRWKIGPPPPGPWLALLARALGLLCSVLVIHWIQAYNGGVGLRPRDLDEGANDTGPIFAWHPILMILAFAVFMAEALLSYQAPLFLGISRPARKQVHYTLQTLALGCVVLGLIAAFQSHNLKLPTPIPNLYTSHSYLGATAVVLLLLQYIVGFTSYLYPKISLGQRVALAPVHRFLGMATWTAGLAACAVGLQDRSSILQFTKANIFGAPMTAAQLRSPTLLIPASIEVLLVLLALAVLYHQVPAATVSASSSETAPLLDEPVADEEAAVSKTGAPRRR